MTTDLTETITTYVRFWNADDDRQRQIAASLFTDDVAYRSVPGFWTGVEPLVDFRRQFIANVGGATYRPRRVADQHHGRARIPWEIVLADGTSFATGTDILEVGDDGKVHGVSAFVDRAPEGFEHHDEAHDPQPA